jgi:hypothetical protein
MKTPVPNISFRLARFLITVVALFVPAIAFAQGSPAASEKDLYDRIRAFALGGGSVAVNGLTLNRDRRARGTVHALGLKTNFQIRLPAKPSKVELDPQRWALSDKTSTKGN